MGWWETGVWYLGGLSTYTRSGFNEAYRHFDKNALNLDLSGKVYIVTGTSFLIINDRQPQTPNRGE